MILIYDNSVSTLVHLFLSYDTAVVHLRGMNRCGGRGGGDAVRKKHRRTDTNINYNIV